MCWNGSLLKCKTKTCLIYLFVISLTTWELQSFLQMSFANPQKRNYVNFVCYFFIRRIEKSKISFNSLTWSMFRMMEKVWTNIKQQQIQMIEHVICTNIKQQQFPCLCSKRFKCSRILNRIKVFFQVKHSITQNFLYIQNFYNCLDSLFLYISKSTFEHS